MGDLYTFSNHALLRMKERGYTQDEVLMAVQFGYPMILEGGVKSFKVTHKAINSPMNDRELKRCLRKISNLRVIVDPMQSVIVTVMEHTNQPDGYNAYLRFRQEWVGYFDIEEQDNFFLAGIMLKVLPDYFIDAFLRERKTGMFCIYHKVVHDGVKFYIKDESNLILPFSHLLRYSRETLKKRNLCPVFYPGYRKLYKVLERFEDMKYERK